RCRYTGPSERSWRQMRIWSKQQRPRWSPGHRQPFHPGSGGRSITGFHGTAAGQSVPGSGGYVLDFFDLAADLVSVRIVVLVTGSHDVATFEADHILQGAL